MKHRLAAWAAFDRRVAFVGDEQTWLVKALQSIRNVDQVYVKGDRVFIEFWTNENRFRAEVWPEEEKWKGSDDLRFIWRVRYWPIDTIGQKLIPQSSVYKASDMANVVMFIENVARKHRFIPRYLRAAEGW